MARRTTSRCDVALRPRGRAWVAMRGAGGANAWQEATQMGHAGAREGAGTRRAHGNSGTLVI